MRVKLVGIVLLVMAVAGTASIAAAQTASRGSDKFTDIPAGHWADKAVGWAVDNGITTGTSDTTFTPNGTLTRAHLVTFLHRYHRNVLDAAITTSRGSNKFTDIPEGHWADKAVGWAVDYGITSGTSDTTFSPNDTLTRAQTVTFLHRYHRDDDAHDPSRGSDTFTDLHPFHWADKAVGWAVDNGITTGTSDTTFTPNGTLTRAQMVTFLHRYHLKVAGPTTTAVIPPAETTEWTELVHDGYDAYYAWYLNVDDGPVNTKVTSGCQVGGVYVDLAGPGTSRSQVRVEYRFSGDTTPTVLLRVPHDEVYDLEQLAGADWYITPIPGEGGDGEQRIRVLRVTGNNAYRFLNGLARNTNASLHVHVYHGSENAHVYSAHFDLTGARKAVEDVTGYCRDVGYRAQ